MAPPPFAPPFKSKAIVTIFQELATGPKLARDIASVLKVQSKNVFPRLKRYIQRGWVTVRKLNSLNVYSLSPKYQELLGLSDFDSVKRRAQELLGRELDGEEELVLMFLFERKGYVENWPNETVAEQIYHGLGRKVGLTRIQEILAEFTMRRIVFAFRHKRGAILKIRLDKSLSH